LVVDTRGDLEQGAELANAVRAITSLPWTVVYTHAHFDHAWGSEPFLPCEVWAHEGCRAELDDHAETARAQWIAHYRDEGRPAIAEAIARTTVIRPSRTFTGRVPLDLGGRAAMLRHAGPAHGDPVHVDFVRRHRDGLRRLVALRTALDRAEVTRDAAIAASPYPADVTEAALATPEPRHSQ
jgi:hypothetical protein